jgi:hypothetical protein
MTTTISSELRDKIKRTLYYGQLTNFLRVVLECLVEEIDNNNMVGVTKFIHREGPLTLTPKKEINDASNGQDKG